MRAISAQPGDFVLPAQGKFALVIIDMQRDFLEPGGFGEALGNNVGLLRPIIPTVKRLLDAFRAHQWPVIHSVEGHRPMAGRHPLETVQGGRGYLPALWRWRSRPHRGADPLPRGRLCALAPAQRLRAHPVLHGAQRDQNDTATAGTLMINPPGTSHSVVSEAGCVVLAIYEKPVAFNPGTNAAPTPELKPGAPPER